MSCAKPLKYGRFNPIIQSRTGEQPADVVKCQLVITAVTPPTVKDLKRVNSQTAHRHSSGSASVGPPLLSLRRREIHRRGGGRRSCDPGPDSVAGRGIGSA